MACENNEVALYLDDIFGSEVEKLKDLNDILNDASKKKSKLANQLTIIRTEVPSKIKAALASSNKALDKVEDLELAKKGINSEVTEFLKVAAPGVERLQQSIRKINDVQCYTAYIKWIMKIEETSGCVQQSILSDSMEGACEAFKGLLDYFQQMVNNSSKCENLTNFLKKTIMFWYNILKNKLTKAMDEITKQIGWPFISAPGPHSFAKPALNPDKLLQNPNATLNPASHLESVFVNLLHIQLPSCLSIEECNSNRDSLANTAASDEGNRINTSDMSDGDVILLPFQLLLRPLKKRFRFHFFGSKQTNALNKPEWYLTQVITWISHHAGFLEHTIQPILDDNGYSHVDALMMFGQGLLQLVTSKLAVDIETIVYDDDLFTHVVDEVLLFDRELRVSYDISDALLKTYGPLKVLTRPDCIRKWLSIEKTCAEERLDGLLSSDDAWTSHFSHADSDEIDEAKTPQCAETFITMLLTITDRYKNLPCYEDQLQFLDLQLLLLDDFRIRLTQVLRSLNTGQCDDVSISILNAALYITTVLREWADNVFFLELKYHKDEEETKNTNVIVPQSLLKLGEGQSLSTYEGRSTDQTVFAEVVGLYERIYSEGLEKISRAILTEFMDKSRPYLHDQWLALPAPEEQVALVVSRSACPMLEVVQQRLYSFEQKLCRTLFTKLWRYIAEKIDYYLYEEVVLRNRFNAGGASQLQFDMTRNLFALFGPYTNKPENYFKRMKEASQLLNLTTGNALLLKEAISDQSQIDDAFDRVVPKADSSKILDELGVTMLRSDDVYRILKLRIDWNRT